MKLTTHIPLVPRLGVRVSMLPLIRMSSRRWTKLSTGTTLLAMDNFVNISFVQGNIIRGGVIHSCEMHF
jgi:hypothetical protein